MKELIGLLDFRHDRYGFLGPGWFSWLPTGRGRGGDLWWGKWSHGELVCDSTASISCLAVSCLYHNKVVFPKAKQGEWQIGISVVQSIHFHSAMVLPLRSHFIIVAENKHQNL